MKTKNNIAIAVFVFISLMLTGIVYAASTGNLEYSGYVARSVNVDLQIANATLLNPRTGETVTVSPALDYKTIQINVNLVQPGDERIIEFQIENIGSVSATLDNLITSNPDPTLSGIIITWPQLTNLTILPTQTSQVFQIKIKWDLYNPVVTSGMYNYTATINYAQ